MQLVFLIATLLTTFLVLCSAASGAKQEPSAPPLPEQVKRLDAWVGTWDAEIEMMGATSTGSEVCRRECGGLWLVTEHTATVMGAPYQGKGFTGFDPARDSYSGVWIDSTGGPMSVYTNGEFSADGKTFTALVDGVDMQGKPAHFEYLTKFSDARTRTFEIFQVDGGKKELQMRIRYTKRK
jgi:hypothetical protein